MTRTSTRTGTVSTVVTVDAPRARRTGRRRSAMMGMGLGAGLLLAGCGMGGGADPSETTGSPGPTETVTETASPSATASPTDSEPTSEAPSEGASGESGTGPTASYTTESGAFTWTFPETWTASQEAFDDEQVEYLGVPYEETLFHDPEETVEYRATTGVGPTDNDGPKPEVVEVLEAEELPDVPVAGEGPGAGPVWYRASLLRPGADYPDPPDFEGGEYLLSVQVVNVEEGVDPEATDTSHWSAWAYVQPPEDGVHEGAAAFLFGNVTQDTAEAVTGLESEEAMRAFLETEEYGQLRSVATSMEVTAP